jgi:hypothetical protein
MFKSLTKSRKPSFYSNQVKVLLLIVIGVLFWNSNDARKFTAIQLHNFAEMITPEPQTLGEQIDSFFGN